MKKFCLSLLALVAAAISVSAEPVAAPGVSYDKVGDAFHKGAWEIGAGAAVMFSPFGATQSRPTHNYALAVGQLGYMLTDIKEWGPARGNFEVVGELFGGGVFVGRGNYVTGMTLWGRYNFVQPDWKWVPYAQIGAGFGATDIDKAVIGQVFQFNLDAAVGVRYFLRPNLALNAEYRYQHLSNANSGPKNVGINAQGALLGASWFF